MKTKIFCGVGPVRIGQEVTPDMEASIGYQEVDASRLMELVSKDPHLLEQLRAMLAAACKSGEIHGAWDAQSDFKEQLKVAEEEWKEKRFLSGA